MKPEKAERTMRNKRILIATPFIVASTITVCIITYGIHPNLHVKAYQQATARPKKRTIGRVQSRSEPFEFTELRSRGRPLKLDDPFDDDDPDWLKHVQFRLKNTSSQPITCISLDIDYPETKTDQPMIASQMTFGRSFISNSTIAFESPPLLLIPGDVFTFTLSDVKYDRIKSFLTRNHYNISDLTRIQIRLVQVQFADGTIWDGGSIYHRDANSPTGWRKIAP
jgi:hypothetical protein